MSLLKRHLLSLRVFSFSIQKAGIAEANAYFRGFYKKSLYV
jgi:hypothetical protein